MKTLSQEWNNIAFGRYRIESTLGEGGMGIVYRAFDTHLHRTVALKVLRPSHLADSRPIQRFLLEARAASALNHPNICTVYDAGQVQDDCYIVLEYLQGQTLRTLLQKKNRLPLDQVLQIGVAVCDALHEAHRKGIIHRDIKPENIMVTDTGIVKIMDFGLAKLKPTTGDFETTSTDELFPVNKPTFTTSMSSFLGTAAYMSPEQIQKATTDERTDLFSLGMVLFESLSGQHPFQGRDTIALMKSIVHDPPKALQPKNTRLSSLLEIAMAKNPAHRFKDASAMGRALHSVRHRYQGQRSPRRWKLIASAIMLLVAGAAYLFMRGPAQGNGQRAQLPRFNSIGQTMETEEWPAFSPDGRKIAYSVKKSEKSEARNLYVKDISTQRRKLVIASEHDVTTAGWSPDGSKLAYAALGRGIFTTDTTGREQRQITTFGFMPRWSPDGNQIVFIDCDPLLVGAPNRLYRCTMATGRIDTLTNDKKKYAYPGWSPDGRWLIATTGEGSRWEMCLIDPVKGKVHVLTHTGLWIKHPVWSRAHPYIYFISNQNGFNEVWRQTIDPQKPAMVGERVQITAGTDIDELDVSSTDDRLLLTWADLKSDIWQVRFSASTRNPIADAKKLLAINGAVDNLALSPGADKLAVEILEKGTRYFLVRSLRDSSETTLHCGQNMYAPAWSADGEWLYFDAGGGDQADLYRMNVHGGNAEHVVTEAGADWMPTCSPVSSQFCFLSNRTGLFQLWLFQPNHEQVQLTDSRPLKSRAFWSHHGDRIAFFENEDNRPGNGSWLCINTIKDRQTIRLNYLPNSVTPLTTTINWSPGDLSLYYFSQNEPGVLCEFNFADRSTTQRRLDDFGFPFFQGTFAMDNEAGFFVWLHLQKDIWISEEPL